MTTLGRGLILAMTLGLCAYAVDAQTFKSVDALAVVDANGKKVGGVVWAFPDPDYGQRASILTYEVVLEASGHMFRLHTGFTHRLEGETRNQGLDAVNILFESSDCSGVPYVIPDAGNAPEIVQLAILGPPGRTAYIPDPSATPKQIMPQSFGDNSTAECHVGKPTQLSSPVTAVRALPLLDLAKEFTPPVRIGAVSSTTASCCGDCNGDGSVTPAELITAVNCALGH